MSAAAGRAAGRAAGLVRAARAALGRDGAPAVHGEAASRDPLTGLGNRVLLHEHARTTLVPGTPARALLLLDLDGFKQLNDAVGHVAGDQVLQEVAARLAGAVDPGDLVVRLGGDEFVVVSAPLTDEAAGPGAEQLADRLLASLVPPIAVDDVELRVGASVGVAVLGRDGSTLEGLLRAADQAMYAAKAAGVATGLRRRSTGTSRGGRGGWSDGADDGRLAADLGAALARADAGGPGDGGLLLHHQPQVSWDGQVSGFESLLRWQHPALGLLGPRRFLPVAQRAGLLGRLTLVALEQALAAQPLLAGAGRSVTVSVNVSARDLLGHAFADAVAGRLAAAGVAPERLVLEISEPAAFPAPTTVDLFHRLAALGVGISIHEFGARQSSLAALAHYPGIREVKVDPTLVRQLPGDEGITRLVRAITGAAHGLGVEVVAEGVERAEVVPALREVGCDRLQGFWLAPPAPLAEALAWADRWPAERELRLTV